MQNSSSEIIIDEISLSMQPGLGNRTRVHLLEVFGDARSVYAATAQEIAERASVRPDVATVIASKGYHRQAEAELEHCKTHGIVAVGCSSDYFPPLLRECCDYPLVLYTVGNIEALRGDMLAVVGTRKVSSYGTAVCTKLISGLAGFGHSMTIVSGLAYGVDAAAHRAALDAGLTTVAVLGNKLPRIYPADNNALARKIIEQGGCIVSEMNSISAEGRMNFVARNRIIAGISRGTIIVESPLKGGSMITAEMASGYDRTVMAVPGRITDENSGGTNRLIRQLKAVPVTCPEDIAEELCPETRKQGEKVIVNKTPDPLPTTCDPTGEKTILINLIAGEDAVTVDRLADRTGFPAQKLMADLFELELEGRIRRTPGGTYTII